MTLTLGRALDKSLCASAHVLTLTAMACFILFVEETILVAGISGVNTIRTTGQLIPFVIGVFSLAVALRDLISLFLWNVSDHSDRRSETC
jgi:hypothetical protein